MKNILFVFLILSGLMACDGQKEVENENPRGISLAYMDTTVSPGDDFYRFVNGKWLDSVLIPADRGRWGSFDELRIMTSKNTRAVLETAMNNGRLDGSTDKGKALIFYSVAMDTVGLDSIGLQPIQHFLKEIRTITSPQDIARYLRAHFKVNGSPYFDMQVHSGFDNSDYNSLYLDPGVLGLPEREYYMNSDSATLRIQDNYKSLLEKVFDRLKVDGGSENMAKSVFQLEKAMAENQLTKEKRRNTQLLNNPMKVEAVDLSMNFLNLSDFLKSQNAKDVDTIIVTQPGYITGLDKIMTSFNIDTHKAYLMWIVFKNYGDFMDQEAEDLLFSFYGKVLEGIDAKKPRWERVLNTVNYTIGETVGQLYVETYFPGDAKEEALRLVDNVKLAFANRIKNLDWMTDTTKRKALEKLSTFHVKIGYPDEWKDYSGLTLETIDSGGSYAGNMERVMIWEWQDDVIKIGKPVDKSEWFMAPQTVNAYYNPSSNEIVFPAAILQPPFFDFQADPAVNYGGIGAVIGHEISHGFDDRGARFDADGNLKNWWTTKDKEAFDVLTAQLAKQYDQYKPFDDLGINGSFTLGENIGDLGGVNVAYDALKMALEGKENVVIDGFTQPQRFFINWATIWRTKYRDEALRKQIKTDPHAPGQYRAIGPILNMDSFYEAFEVKEDDKLFTPEEKRIKIW